MCYREENNDKEEDHRINIQCSGTNYKVRVKRFFVLGNETRNLNRSFDMKEKEVTGWQVEGAPLKMKLGSQRDTSNLISMHLSPFSIFLRYFVVFVVNFF